MATKAFEQLYPGEAEFCEDVQFYSLRNRLDLVGDPDVQYIVFDARPFPLCVEPPPDRPWADVERLASLIITQGNRDCVCESDMGARPKARARTLMTRKAGNETTTQAMWSGTCTLDGQTFSQLFMFSLHFPTSRSPTSRSPTSRSLTSSPYP